MKRLVILFGLWMVVGSLAHAQERPELTEQMNFFVAIDAPVVALTNAQVIDGTGGPVRQDMTILIEGSHISAYGTAEEVNIPEGAIVQDLQGHTVIPGFIGLHNHTFYTTSRRRVQANVTAPILYLASGVTTIRTTGSNAPYSELNLKRAIENGEMVGPRLFVTGPYITGGSGMGYMTKVHTPEAARRVVRYWAEEGVSWFKAYTEISKAELGAAIDEAHKQGIKVTGHLCSVSYKEAVALGIDNLEHGLFTNTDYYPEKPEDGCPTDFRSTLLNLDLEGEAVQSTFKAMIENDVPMTSTLAVYEMFVPGRPAAHQRTLDAMSPDVQKEYEEMYAQIQSMADKPEHAFTPELLEQAMAYEYAFVQAGGLLASGVDPTGYGGALPGFGDQRNYELLREAGFSPAEVIRIMTANGAKVLGIEDEVGTIAPGMLADLAIIEGDPVADASDIRKVRLVMKDGRAYDSGKLISRMKGMVGVE